MLADLSCSGFTTHCCAQPRQLLAISSRLAPCPPHQPHGEKRVKNLVSIGPI